MDRPRRHATSASACACTHRGPCPLRWAAMKRGFQKLVERSRRLPSWRMTAAPPRADRGLGQPDRKRLRLRRGRLPRGRSTPLPPRQRIRPPVLECPWIAWLAQSRFARWPARDRTTRCDCRRAKKVFCRSAGGPANSSGDSYVCSEFVFWRPGPIQL